MVWLWPLAAFVAVVGLLVLLVLATLVRWEAGRLGRAVAESSERLAAASARLSAGSAGLDQRLDRAEEQVARLT